MLCVTWNDKNFCFCLAPEIKPDSTPAKTPRTESIGGLASPRLAVCAPSGAALPLPSITTSPLPSQDAKAAAARQRTPSSIKQWLSPSHGSPIQASPVLHKVLNPSTSSPSERRAKRRLETGDSSPTSCESAENCDCVSELYPAAKRGRVLSGICCTAQESQVQTDGQAESNKQASPKQSDKENCSPRVDWLSVMGQKMRKGHGNSGSPRSPSASKKQEGKTPASPVGTFAVFPLFCTRLCRMCMWVCILIELKT